MYEVFAHTADVGIRVRAGSLEDLFADAARGLVSLIVTNLEQVKPVQEKVIRIEGDDREYLLFDWLNELLYQFDAEQLLLTDFTIRFDRDGLTATCRGERMEFSRHDMDHEVKAITYHGLTLERKADHWLAEVIVDI